MLSSAIVLAVALAVSTPYTVVLRDGSAIQAVKAPATRGPLVVATLLDGTSVSISTAKVDWLATEVANRPEVVERRVGRAAAAQPKRYLIDNRAIEEHRRRRGVASASPESRDAAGVTALPEDEPGAAVVGPVPLVARPSDPTRRSPEYWRDRARDLRDRQRRASRELAAAEASYANERDVALYGRRVSSADGSFTIIEYSQSDEERAVRAYRLSTLAAEVDRARAGVDEVAAAEAELHEEARVARAEPGWLRPP